MHGKRVHDPGHYLCVRVYVGGWDVAIRTHEDGDLGREPPRHVLEFAESQLSRIDDDAAFGTTVGDVDDRTFPGHPHRQRFDLVQRHVRVEPDAPLGRTSGDVVLDAVAGENLDPPVVHLNREVAGELALDLAQDLAELRLQPADLRRRIELALGGAPLVGLLPNLDRRGHRLTNQIKAEERGYSAFGSQRTFTQAGTPERNARAIAGPTSSACSTSSPCPPS